MRQKFEKGSEMYFMLQDYWKLIQDFWIAEEDDEYWNALVGEVDKFYRKYQTKFAKALVFALLDKLENDYKEMTKERMK